MFSVVVAHGFCCSVECGILLDQGSNLCILNWQADSLSLSYQGIPNTDFFFFFKEDFYTIFSVALSNSLPGITTSVGSISKGPFLPPIRGDPKEIFRFAWVKINFQRAVSGECCEQMRKEHIEYSYLFCAAQYGLKWKNLNIPRHNDINLRVVFTYFKKMEN